MPSAGRTLAPQWRRKPNMKGKRVKSRASKSNRTFKPAEARNRSLNALCSMLPQRSPDFGYGADIDHANEVLLDANAGVEEKISELRNGLSRNQPCLFGRIAAKNLKGFDFDVCWISVEDIISGDLFVQTKIQFARRSWKSRASKGLSHGFLIMFNDPRLAFAAPSEELVGVCRRVGELYLIEACPIQTDVIYTEAVPLVMPTGMHLFKAGCNLFYTGAHRTLNHDRRIPGGILVSVNSPGHLANSLVTRGIAGSFRDAVQQMRGLAQRSIGSGGLGYEAGVSTSWHHAFESADGCPAAHRSLAPTDDQGRFYSALYHSDVLVPSKVTSSNELDPARHSAEVWPWLILDYITDRPFPTDHINHGLFYGHQIGCEAKYFNPWLPRRATNQPPENYEI